MTIANTIATTAAHIARSAIMDSLDAIEIEADHHVRKPHRFDGEAVSLAYRKLACRIIRSGFEDRDRSFMCSDWCEELCDLLGLDHGYVRARFTECARMPRMAPEPVEIRGKFRNMDRDRLREYLMGCYWGEEMSMRQIAERAGISRAGLQHWFNKLKIPRRSGSEAQRLRARKGC